MMKRAILYARISSDDRRYATSSIEGQLAECRAFAAKHGYNVISEVNEDPNSHTSGADWLPELEKVIQLAANKSFDVLIVRELDRLARNLAKQLVIEAELKRHGVQIVYVLGDYPDTPEGMLMKNMRGVIAEYEKALITQRMVRGRRNKAKAGYIVSHGPPPYGFRQATEDEKAADPKMTVVIDEAEAAVVRQIYAWYLGSERIGTRLIAERLSAMGVPTPADSGKGRGKGRAKIRPFARWGNTTVAKILRSEVYSGEWHYSKYKAAQDPSKIITVPIPAIISPEQLQQAKERTQENLIKASRNVRHDYLLRRRVFCGECGSAMGACYAPSKGKDFFYYKCDTPYDKGVNSSRTCRQTKHFRADHVDTLVWEWVKSYLADPAKLAEGLATYQSEHEKVTAPLRDRMAIVDKLIVDNQGQLDRLIDLFLTGDFSKDTLLERKSRLADTLASLEREREGLAAQLTVQSLTIDEMQSMMDFADEVAQGLTAADEDFETRRRIIEILDLRSTLAIEDGEKVVYPRCRFWDGNRLLVVSTSIDSFVHNPQISWILNGRLVLNSIR